VLCNLGRVRRRLMQKELSIVRGGEKLILVLRGNMVAHRHRRLRLTRQLFFMTTFDPPPLSQPSPSTITIDGGATTRDETSRVGGNSNVEPVGFSATSSKR
jgi:hypothetical protein